MFILQPHLQTHWQTDIGLFQSPQRFVYLFAYKLGTCLSGRENNCDLYFSSFSPLLPVAMNDRLHLCAAPSLRHKPAASSNPSATLSLCTHACTGIGKDEEDITGAPVKAGYISFTLRKTARPLRPSSPPPHPPPRRGAAICHAIHGPSLYRVHKWSSLFCAICLSLDSHKPRGGGGAGREAACLIVLHRS